MMPNKFPFRSNKLNWFTITREYWKEQLAFFFLATLSCLGAFLVSANAWKKLLGGNDSFLFEGSFFGKEFWVWEFNSRKGFNIVMFVAIAIACLIVILHVYYAYWFANKITTAVKKKLAQKLFALQNTQDKEKSLSVLTNNTRTFSYLVIFVPNQIYYALLDTLLVFAAVRKAAKSMKDNSLIWWGVFYYLLILGVVFLFQYLVYKKDRPFQKSFEKRDQERSVFGE